VVFSGGGEFFPFFFICYTSTTAPSGREGIPRSLSLPFSWAFTLTHQATANITPRNIGGPMKELLFLTILFTATAAFASDTGGRTADGCTYRIINGQYLTSCPGKGAKAEAAPVMAAAAPAPRGPVTSYGDVPVRRNSAANAPSLPPMQPVAAPASAREPAIEGDYYDEAPASRSKRSAASSSWADKTFAGITVGASNMKESNAGSTTGIGLNLGTNIDETFGVELGYSYSSQRLNLGLASRGASADQQPAGGFGGPASATDSKLTSHLFTGEGQAYLTDPGKRLRPYLGAGLGWRSATLAESANRGTHGSGAAPLAGGSLHQNSFGGLASAGTKLRIGKAFHLGFAFRYFFPLARQDARLEQPAFNPYGSSEEGGAVAQSKLDKADDSLTGSSQYQILGGLQYSF